MASANLSQRLKARDLVVAPGVYDLMSVLMADAAGFDALFLSGYWLSSSHLGLPDAGLATFRDFEDRIRIMSERTQTPLIADADTGFGGPLNVRHTVQGYEKAGAAAIQLEDQTFPKKCGHQPGTRVVTTEEMTTRIKVAVDARRDENFVIIARSDALGLEGLEATLDRAAAYREAGADVTFIENPRSEEEMAKICAMDAPQMINMAHGGKTPLVSADRLREIGYSLAIVPSAAPLAALNAMQAAYAAIKSGDIESQSLKKFDFHAFSDLIGFDEIRDFEDRWS